MRTRFALILVLCFAAGGLLTAGLGGVSGIFDRGPSELDVSDAEVQGREEAGTEVERGKETELARQRQLGYDRGREGAEWVFIDRMPNPDSWFAGVIAGRTRLQEMADQAYQSGFSDGERAGRDEALAARGAN